MTGKPELVLVKLGGSLITDKRRPNIVRLEVIERLAQELRKGSAEDARGFILGHGSGSFGHTEAALHGIGSGALGPEQRPGVITTQQGAADLHRLVVRALQKAGVLPYSLAPSSFLVAAAGRPAKLELEPLEIALDTGLMPVVWGDVVMDREWGASICSTETVFGAVIEALLERTRKVSEVIWLGETDGIYDQEGSTIPVISPKTVDQVMETLGGAEGTDVTGGMRHRLETAARLANLGISSWIVNGLIPELLERRLSGEVVPGTQVSPG